MPAGPGRDPIKAMMRLVRIMAALHGAGSVGKPAAQLIAIAGYGQGDPETQLKRDLNHLTNQGWHIENLTTDGGPAVYRMVTADNRLRLKLTTEQRAALQRAVMVARRGDIAKRLGIEAGRLPSGFGSEVLPHAVSTELTLALQALRLRSRIRFGYKGTPRVVDPSGVRHQNQQWYLSGVEDGGEVLKHFVVARMNDVELEAPATAQSTPKAARIHLHPLNWEIDPPTEVILRVPGAYVLDAVRWLRSPAHQEQRGDEVDLTYVVTNRAAFRSRLYLLGTRVRVVSPDEFRAQLLDDLRDLVGL